MKQPPRPETPAKPAPSPKPEPAIAPATKPETLAKPVPVPNPDTGLKPAVKSETAAKAAPLPEPDTGTRPVVRAETTAKPEPVKPTSLPPVVSGKSFFPDTGMGAVFFGHASTRIHSEDTARLRANVEYLKNHPGLEVLLVGYCDSVGEPEYNLLLGLLRAQAVRRWLVRHGVDAARISLQSNGSEWAFGTEPGFMWQDRRCEFWTRGK